MDNNDLNMAAPAWSTQKIAAHCERLINHRLLAGLWLVIAA